MSAKIKRLPAEDFKEFILILRQLSINYAQEIANQIPVDDDQEISDF